MRRLIPAGVWAALLFWLSAQSSLPHAVFLFNGIDKVFHAGAYAVLAVLIYIAAPPRWRSPALTACLIASLYGVTDELHQAYVPGRSCDVFDWIADSSGAALGLVAWRWLLAQQWRRRHGR